jgi:hypothetical protein
VVPEAIRDRVRALLAAWPGERSAEPGPGAAGGVSRCFVREAEQGHYRAVAIVPGVSPAATELNGLLDTVFAGRL